MKPLKKSAWHFFGVLLLVLPAACGKAETPKPSVHGFAVPKEQPVKASLVAKPQRIAEGSAQVGVYFEMKEGWHIYAKEPGDAGMPTQIDWASIPGVHFSELIWPPAETFTDPGNITTHGYKNSVLLASQLTYVARESLPELPVSAKVRWLACKEICIPGEASLTMNLEVTP